MHFSEDCLRYSKNVNPFIWIKVISNTYRILFHWQPWCSVKLCNIPLCRRETTTEPHSGEIFLCLSQTKSNCVTLRWPGHTSSPQLLIQRRETNEPILTQQIRGAAMAREWVDHLRAEAQVEHELQSAPQEWISAHLSNDYRLSTNIHWLGGVAASQPLLYCFSWLSRRRRGTIEANNNNVAVRTVREARSARWYSKQASPLPSHGLLA